MTAITRRRSLIVGATAFAAALTATAIPESAEASVWPGGEPCKLPGYRNINLGTAKLRKGSRGDRVKDLQRGLNLAVYRKVPAGTNYQGRLCPITEDGVFGNATFNRLVRLQSDYGLQPDGVVGPQTREMIYDNYAYSRKHYG